MFEHRHLFESCLLGLLQTPNSFIQGMKQQGLWSSQECFPPAQRHFDFLPEAVLRRRGSAAHLGLPGIRLGQKENSLCEISASPGSEMETANSHMELQQRIVPLESPTLMCPGGKSAAVNCITVSF